MTHVSLSARGRKLLIVSVCVFATIAAAGCASVDDSKALYGSVPPVATNSVARRPAPAPVPKKTRQLKPQIAELRAEPRQVKVVTGSVPRQTGQPRGARVQIGNDNQRRTRSFAPAPSLPVTRSAGRTRGLSATRSLVATRSAAPAARFRSATPVAARPRSRSPQPFETLSIHWGTNRNAIRAHHTGTGNSYRPARFGKLRASKLSTGIARITVPNIDRNVGDIPRPRKITLLSVALYSASEDPKKHFTIGELTSLTREAFLNNVRREMSRSEVFKGHCFVYVHGYRNTFEDAIFRTAQLAADMKFDGGVFAFSWPSQGTVAGYITDRDAADSSQLAFQEFIETVSTRTDCQKVHLIAHSMGTRLVVDAFFPALGRSPLQSLSNIDQIVLASPDIDASVLKTRVRSIGEFARTVTLYANGKDHALKWSKRAAGGYQRAGDVINGVPTVVSGIDTIDLTPMKQATWVFLGGNHNGYATKSHILRDIALLMKSGIRPPQQRFAIFEPVQGTTGTFWRYVRN